MASRSAIPRSTFSGPLLFTLHLVPIVLAQSGDGGGASGNLGGSGSNYAAGASGSGSSFNLSAGAIAAIAIVAGAIIIGALGMAILFWQSKKRQWTKREVLRRSVKRVGTELKKVATPVTATFSPRRARFDRGEIDGFREMRDLKQGQGHGKPGAVRNFSTRGRQEMDLEKGQRGLRFATTERSRSGSDDNGNGRPRQPPSQAPKSSRPKPAIRIPAQGEVDSSLEPKTPMWNKILGRT